jgi:hypothetical protein
MNSINDEIHAIAGYCEASVDDLLSFDQIPDCLAAYEAQWTHGKDIVPPADGDIVTTIKDLIGSLDGSASGTAKPLFKETGGINGRASLLFDGINDLVTFPNLDAASTFKFGFAGTYECVLACKINTYKENGLLIEFKENNSAGFSTQLRTVAGKFNLNQPAFGGFSTVYNAPLGSDFILACGKVAGTAQHTISLLSPKLITTVGGVSSGGSGGVLGSTVRLCGSSSFYDMSVTELYIYNRKLTTTELQKLGNYIKTKSL